MSNKRVLKIPGLGMRSLKTAVSVAVCLVFFEVLHSFNLVNVSVAKEIPFYACTAAVICMQNTVENSVSSGLFRLFGTFIGGSLGIIALLFLPDIAKPLQFITITLGILACMVICNVTKKQKSCAISCVVFMAVIAAMGDKDPFVYALYRIFETVVGVIVVIIVNKFLVVPKFISKRLRDYNADGGMGTDNEEETEGTDMMDIGGDEFLSTEKSSNSRASAMTGDEAQDNNKSMTQIENTIESAESGHSAGLTDKDTDRADKETDK